MIRGETTQFRFEMPDPYVDYCTVEAAFWQDGNTSTRLPIIKYYNSQITDVDSWSEDGKDKRKIYLTSDGTYYCYDGATWIASSTNPGPIDTGYIFEEPNIIGVVLDSEETALFSDLTKAKAQLRAFSSANNKRIYSKEQKFTVYPAFKTDALGDQGQITPTPVISGDVILDAGKV